MPRTKEGTYKSIIMEMLRKNGKPMHYKEITAQVLKHRDTKGKTPEKTIVSVLVKNKEIFKRTKAGTYTLQSPFG